MKACFIGGQPRLANRLDQPLALDSLLYMLVRILSPCLWIERSRAKITKMDGIYDFLVLLGPNPCLWVYKSISKVTDILHLPFPCLIRAQLPCDSILDPPFGVG